MAKITVCVPVYNGAEFVRETLESIAAQTHADISVLISIDQSSDESEAVCRRFCGDDRFRVIVHGERQGWVKNCNGLISLVETELFALIPHDDLLHPSYFARLLDALEANPNAVTAYCDIQAFGTRQGRVVQPGIRGERFRRILDFFINQRASVAFRGLVRRRGPDDRPYLLEDLPKDYAADMVWLLQLAIGGEIIRVSETLYRKRMHEANTHDAWAKWSDAEKIETWVDQCATCSKLALAALSDEKERSILLVAAVLRLFGAVPSRPVFSSSTRILDRAMLATRFGALMGEQAWPVHANALIDEAKAAPLRAGLKALDSELDLRDGKAEEALAAADEAIRLDPLSEHAELQRGYALNALEPA